ncbi:MAG: DUF3108 domain-containing protein [Bdellovibrionota bacterium]
MAILLSIGCAGNPVTKVSSSDNEFPNELPKEIQNKFEVKDATVLAQTSAILVPKPSVSDGEQAATEPTRKKSAKAGKKKKNEVAAREPQQQAQKVTYSFTYPSRRPTRDPIWVSEQHVFGITYFGVPAGDFTLDVLPHKAVAERKVYHIKGTAVSSKLFSIFYRLHDTVETFMDFEGLFSHRFHVVLDETKQSRDSLELYDSEKSQTFYWNRWNHKQRGYTETKEFQPIQPFSQDSLSALFYLRTIPLPEDSIVTFPVVSEGKSWEAVVTVVRREMLDTPIGKVQTVVVKPQTKYQGILQQTQGDSFLWLTDDDRRFVIRLEAKVKIGTVVASLKKLESGTPP